jgi:hypothetical protein
VTAPVDEDEGLATPHDAAAEAAVLGVCLRGDRTPVVDARRALPKGWVYEPRHQRIWDAIEKQDDQGWGTDLYALTQADGLTPDDLLYAHTLLSEAPLTAQLPYYLKQAAKVARLRAADLATMRMQRAIRNADLEALNTSTADARDALDHLDEATFIDDDGWAAVDLTDALDGDDGVTPPDVLMRVDGKFLLYPGRTHSVAGEPNQGKTWLAIAAVAQCLLVGRRVVYLDYEDTPKGIVQRILKFGVPADTIKQLFHYHRPNRALDSPAKALLQAEFDRVAPALVVLDGVTEAMGEQGLEGPGDPNEKVAAFYRTVPRYLVGLTGEHPDGPAVLMIDHVKKEREGRGKWAIGGQHKLAGLSGAAYTFESIKPFDRRAEGRALVRISKDRENQVGKPGEVIAELVLDETGDELKWSLEVPEEMPEDADGQPRPTILMEAISRYLATHAGATKKQIDEAVTGNKQLKLRAVDVLVKEGFVSEAKQGRTALYTNLGHYRREWDRNDR